MGATEFGQAEFGGLEGAEGLDLAKSGGVVGVDDAASAQARKSLVGEIFSLPECVGKATHIRHGRILW